MPKANGETVALDGRRVARIEIVDKHERLRP